MKVCAVVPTYNRKEQLAQCLEALFRQTRTLDEIVIIDNASTDGTREMVTRRSGDQVTYVRLAENTGSAGGFHEGMKLACERGYDWIWCMDDDAIPFDDALERLLEAEDPAGAPVVAKVCPRRDPATGKHYQASAVLELIRRNVGLSQADWLGKVIPIDFAPWAGLLVKGEAARRAGFGNPGLFAWYDDYFFSLGLRKSGRILHVGTTALFHPFESCRVVYRHGRRRLIVEDYWKQYYLSRNLYLFRTFCFGKPKALLDQTLTYVRMMVGILVLDDFRFYRWTILTKAFMDALTGRLGRRVDPHSFRKTGQDLSGYTYRPIQNV